MWGSCLDHVLEVEVVTADGTIQRANETVNSDLFFVGAIADFPPLSSTLTCYRPSKAQGLASA